MNWKHHGQCLHVSWTYHHRYPGKAAFDWMRGQVVERCKRQEGLPVYQALLDLELDEWATYGALAELARDELGLEKNALHQWCKRQGWTGIWRLEFQERFAPHWHTLLWIGDQDPLEVEEKIRAWWRMHSGNTSIYGIKVTSGDEGRAVWYLAMHAAKAEQSPPIEVGKWWGYIDRERFLQAQEVDRTGEIQHWEFVWQARLYRRATGARASTRKEHRGIVQGFSWFLPRAWTWRVVELSRQLASDKLKPKNPF